MTRAFSRSRRDFVVATLVGTSDKVKQDMHAHKPHVALISAELEDGPLAGFRILEKIRNCQCRPASVMLLQSRKPELVVSAFREGARGIFYRSHSLKTLSKCIKAVSQGQIWAANEDLEFILDALVDVKPLKFNVKNGQPILTRREEEVVRLVAAGLKNREVGQRLAVAEHTIRNYLCRIFEKLEISSRMELILYVSSQREQIAQGGHMPPSDTCGEKVVGAAAGQH